MSDCTGKCYEREYKIKEGSLRADPNGDSQVVLNEGETRQQANERAEGVDRPNIAEMLPALARTLKQNTKTIKEECKGEYCECVWPDWGEFLPKDDKDKERWVTITVIGVFERQSVKFDFCGWVEVKVRERNGICIKTKIHPKIAYVPEWEIDLTDEAIEGLSEKSRELLKKRFA